MIYLYIKTHNITGKKYLGQTKNKDPRTYKGSGKYWKLHIAKYGYNVTTEILKECSTKEELKYWGQYYSTLWNIVENDDWANLKPEEGDGGSIKGTNLGRTHSAETKKKISDNTKGKHKHQKSIPKTKQQKDHLSKINTGKKLSYETIEKMSRSKMGKNHKKESIEKMRKPKTDLAKQNMKLAQEKRRSRIKEKWITDGVNNTLISEDSILPNGWEYGRSNNNLPPSQKGKFWANDGINNKMVKELPDGWKKGRLIKIKE
jgi:hypothetical protein